MEIMGDFIYTSSKPLPVILLLDTSRSMEKDGNINTLNTAVRDMLRSFRAASSAEISIQTAIITFGEHTGVYLPLQDVGGIDPDSICLKAGGGTFMAKAIMLAKAMIEDRSLVPSRSYKPYVIMVTDGVPGDNWKQAMDQFINTGRSAKCCRMALGIGDGAKGIAKEVLRRFTGPDQEFFSADRAQDILNFFRYVTMTTQQGNTVHAVPAHALNVNTRTASPEGDGSDESFGDLLPY